MHGQNHDGAKQDEQGIYALFGCVHDVSRGFMFKDGAKKNQKQICTKIKQNSHQLTFAVRPIGDGLM